MHFHKRWFFDRSIQSGNIEPIVRRGKALWDDIYAPFADKLYDKLAAYHPDFIGEYFSEHVPVMMALFGVGVDACANSYP